MKVLFVHDGPIIKIDHEYYGVDYTNDLKERYLKYGDSVTFLMRTRSEKNDNTLNYSKIDSKNFNVISVPDFKNPKRYFKAIKKAKTIIKEAVINHDIIIVRLPSSISMLAIKYAKLIDKPYFVELVACIWDALWNKGILEKIIAPFEFLNLKKAVYHSSFVLYVTDQFLQKRYPTKGRNIGCSDVILLRRNEDILFKRLDKIKNKEQDKTVILGTVAAVNVKFKGQQYVLEALAKLKREGYKNFEYQLIGGGNTSFLSKKAKKLGISLEVKFLGALPHKNVFEWLESIDIYIQPSKQEGLPRALIEAMSMGVPALGSTAGGTPELLEEVFIFNKGDPAEIADRILKLNVKEVLLEQAKRNYYYVEKYNEDALAVKRSDFYLKFLNELQNETN
ncbi:Glycosyltransferase involved in cell wall bisynthesis [Eubacterium maltosivorans]|uniref:glycosyltransferase family 4 protein n=1 Tax=Eubacterium maltosivorans TaxID=2041044 RepID=UPI00088234C8|nr:glycosyltransferase family 4 protein [Eubacterium maltosivorans]WPK79439.1 hypothetical protein EUMA32_08460 [Eubacterium maltosivorans]SDP40804.1 Glycosyltransferase involved in cell wall bisynthesis [Eubacterium maltosivorans]